MQDKEKNITRIDKQFQDHSWSAMRKILDEEMPRIPVKEGRKKRYFFLLAILLVGFISGIGTMVYVYQQQKVEFSTPVKAEEELAESSRLFENEVANDHDKKITNISNLSKSTLEQKAAEDRDFLKNIEKSKIQKRNGNSISTTTFNNKPNLFGDVIKSKYGDLKSQDTEQKLQKGFKVEKTESLDFIPSKTVLLETPKMFTKIDLLETPKKKKWRFGITLGTYSNNNRIFAGITLGGKADYDLNRRFSIGSGLQYSILSGFKEGQSNRMADGALELSNPGNNNQEADFFLDGTESSISSRSKLPISNLHYLELPVELAYRFSKKFQIHLGAKAGYLVKATADGYLNSNSFTYSQRLNDKDLYQSLNKFDFAATLGIGFFPWKKFGIDLRYNHGLIDFTRNDVWIQGKSNTNKNVQFSAIFLFGKG